MDRERYRQREKDFVAGKKREIAESVEGFTDEFLEAMLPAGVIVDMVEARLLEATINEVVGMVYLAFFKDMVDRKLLADDTYWRLREHYEIVLANKVREVGCDPGRVRLEESEELTYLRRRADESASLIVDTYNKNLRSAVEKIVVEYAASHEGSLAGLNRNVLAYRVRQWEADRAVWKDKQIAVTEATFAAHRTVTQFLLLNAIEARVYVRPVAAVCADCEQMVRNSPYTPAQAANLILPRHPGCPHIEDVIYDRSTIPGCENLWRGQPVWQLGESLAEGGWGSGNFDHLGGDGKGPGGSQARGGTGLSKEVRLSRHAFQRMGERKKYSSVKAGLKSLKDKEVPDGDWHMGVKRGGKLDAVLIGTDGVVKTVLGPWAKNLKGDDLGED